MRDALNILVGRVFAITIAADQATLFSEDGVVLNIYNQYSIVSPEGAASALREDMSTAVLAVECSTDEAAITFTDGSRLLVDLSPEGYRGPEAMQLRTPGGEIVVWS